MYKIVDSNPNNFDFIRLIVAVLVIFSHSYILADGTYWREPLSLLTHRYETAGDLGVDIFFLISGYLVTASYMRSETVWSYFRKRIARIYPGFIGATIFTLLVAGPLSLGHLRGSTLLSQTGVALVKMISLRDLDWVGAFTANPYPLVVNGSLWTIHFEFACYIVLAVAGICGVLRSRRACLSLCALSLIAKIVFATYIWNRDDWTREGLIAHGVRFLPLFFAGTASYLYRDKLVFRYRWALVAALLLAVATQTPDGLSCMFPLAGTYLVLFFAYNPAIRFQRFLRFGDFSYGTYLYACPIQQLLVLWAHGHLNLYVLFFLATPLAVIAGAISWHLVEKRFLVRTRISREEHRMDHQRLKEATSCFFVS